MASVSGSAYILFTRVPIPGMVKTRLASVLSPEQRASFQEALVIDTVLKLSELDGTIVLCCSDEHEHVDDGGQCFDTFVERVKSACPTGEGIEVSRQRGNKMGQRMSNALVDTFGMGAGSCLLIGSDLPYITPSDLACAEELLERTDVVFGPSPDGGYWLVGVKSPFPELFEDERYGEDDVLERAVRICERYGKTIAFAPSSSDVDTPEDYAFLRSRVADGDTRVGALTAASVIG